MKKDKIESPEAVYEDSEVPIYNEPMQNAYEEKRNSDFNQSGTK